MSVSVVLAQVPGTGPSIGGRVGAVPRTAFGRPDLNGVWVNNNATPLERPKEWAGREFLTEQELEELKANIEEVLRLDADRILGDDLVLSALKHATVPVTQDPKTGHWHRERQPRHDGPGLDLDNAWRDARLFHDRRTAMLTDPVDGRIPALTDTARQLQAADAERARLHPADGPEDRPLQERCIGFIPPLANGLHQIWLSRDALALLHENAGGAGPGVRLVPLDGRPHLPPGVRQRSGDSRGRWEGDTLVVETTNFSPSTTFRGARANLSLTERFTRVSPDMLNWEVTLNDPTTWVRPWTARIPLQRSSAHLYENACHEGNSGMTGTLRGHRVQERQSTGGR